MGVNAYLIFPKDSNEAILIDAPEGAGDAIPKFLEKHDRKLSAILLTHGHFDHVWDCAELKDKTGAQIYAHAETKPFVEVEGAQSYFGFGDMRSFAIDKFLVDGQILKFSDLELECLYAPGHCAGSMMFYSKDKKKLFVGDVIFCNSIGRHDLPTGSFGVLQKSIRTKIYTLPDDVEIFPGHGPETSVGGEKSSNPFVTA